MKRHFPFQPAPGEGESIRSYLHRLTEGNQYECPSWLAGIPDFAAFYCAVPAGKVAGAKPAWLQKVLRGPSYGRSFGSIPRYRIVSGARFCPICLRSSGYWRAEWEYLYYTTCHIHDVELRSTCEKCSKHILWSRPRLMNCRCGADLSNQSTAPANSLESMLGKEMLALARSQPSLNLLPIRFAIGSDNFEDACYFIRIIGRHYNKRYAPTAKNAPVPDLNLSRIHLQQAAALLTNWPENFRIFLRAYAKLDNPDPESYVRSPQLKSLLKALIAFNSRAPVSTETMNLLSELEPVVWDKRHYGLYPKPSIPGKYVHITAFAKKMHVSKQTIEDLIDSGELNAIRRPRGNRQFVLIPTAELKQAQSALTDKLSHKETAQLLGISRKRLSQLREARIFRAGKIRAGAPAQYSYKQIHQFMAQFKVLQKQPKCPDPRSLKDIAKYIASSDHEFIVIVRAVVEQQLHIVHHDPVLGAIAGVHISQAALDEWRDRRRKRVLRIDDVAKRLGFKQEVVYHLVRKGLIKSSVEKLGRRLCRIVLEEDLEQFTSTYISAVEMAKLYGTSPKHLVYRLFRRLIHPETGPKIDGGRQYFYLRLQLRYSDNVFGKSRAAE